MNERAFRLRPIAESLRLRALSWLGWGALASIPGLALALPSGENVVAGLRVMMDTDGAFDTSNAVDDNGTPFDPADVVYDFTSSETNLGSYSGDTVYTAEFRQKTIPKRGSGCDTTMAFYHFDLGAYGATAARVSTALHAGAY